MQAPKLKMKTKTRMMKSLKKWKTRKTKMKKLKKWQAKIKHGLSDVNLGFYENFADAVAARKAAEKKYGYHPNHGVGFKEMEASAA